MISLMIISISGGLNKNRMMNIAWQKNRLRKWLVGFLLLAISVPSASGVYAMTNQQAASNDTPPCHQTQQHEQAVAASDSGHDCCDSLHQCGGNCDHDCTDCYSTGHAPCIVSSSAEPQQIQQLHLVPVSFINNGVTPTPLLRPHVTLADIFYQDILSIFM
jgi:hypothetical protein